MGISVSLEDKGTVDYELFQGKYSPIQKRSTEKKKECQFSPPDFTYPRQMSIFIFNIQRWAGTEDDILDM